MKKLYFSLITFCFLGMSLSAQQLWENFEDVRKGTYGFINGAFIPYNENPDQSGANTSQVAASYTRNAAETFDVLILDAQMADLTDYLSDTKQISIDVWSPAAGKTVQITLENSTQAMPANFPTGRHSVYLTTTTVAMGWETLTFSFDNQPDPGVANTDVDRLVLLFDPNSNNGDTYYWDNLNGPELANDPCDGVTADPDVLNDFECNQNTNFTFSHSGVNFRRVVNPDMGGNPSDYVASYTRNAGETNDVIIGFFDGNLSLTAEDRIKLDVWDPGAPTDVIVSLQNVDDDVILEMTQTTSNSGAWETLIFDPSSVSEATDIAKFVILFDPNSNTSDNYFFDNFGLTMASSVANLAEVTSFEVFPNPTQGQTTFQYDLVDAAQVNLAIFDITGKQVDQVLNARQVAGNHTIDWDASGLANGLYFYTLTVDGQAASGKITLNK